MKDRHTWGALRIKRTIDGLIVIFGTVVIVVFVVTRMIGDPVAMMLPSGGDAPPAGPLPSGNWASTARSSCSSSIRGRPVAVRHSATRSGSTGPGARNRLRADADHALLVFARSFLPRPSPFPLGIVRGAEPRRIIDRVTVILSPPWRSRCRSSGGALLIVLFRSRSACCPPAAPGSFAHLTCPAVTPALPAMARIVMVGARR